MGHIADLMVTSAIMNPSTGFYPRDSSPSSSCDNVRRLASFTFTSNAKQNQSNSKYEDRDQPRFMWRMHQPSQTKKYNLFPHKSHEKLSITTPILGRSFGREVSAAMAKVGNSGNKVRKTVAVGSQQEPVSGMQPPPTVGKMDRSLDSRKLGSYPLISVATVTGNPK